MELPSSVQWASAIMVLASGTVLALGDGVRALAAMPAAALLGPIVRVTVGPMQLHLGDLFLGMLVLLVGGQVLARPFTPFASRGFLIALALLVLLSWYFSVNAVASLVAIVGLAQLLVVLLLTLQCVRRREDTRRILLGWIGAVALSSVVVLVAFLQGRSLLIGVDAERAATLGLDTAARGLLFRGTFFVTPFIFPLVSAILLTLTLLLLDEAGTRRRLFLVCMVPLFAITALAMGNLSVMAGTLIGVVTLVLWSLAFRRAVQRTLLLVMAAVVIAGLLAAALAQVADPQQLQLLRERVDDTTSFDLRVAVWRNVVQYLAQTPKVFLLGLGPDISIRTPELPVLRELFLGAGVQQEAVDSGYLYGALNFGIPALVAALLMALVVLWRLSRRLLRRADPLALAVWVTMVAWLAMCVTQQHGISKPVFFLAQALALGERLTPIRWRG